MPNRQDFISYALISDPTDPAIDICLNGAIRAAKSAGIPEFLFAANDGAGDDELNLYIYMMAAYEYDNRAGMIASDNQNLGQSEHFKFITTKKRLALKYRRPPAETGGANE